MSFQQSSFGDTGDLLCNTVVYLACAFTCEFHSFLLDLQLSVHDLERYFREVPVGVREVFCSKFHIIGSCICCFYDVVAIEREVVLAVLIVIDTYIIALHCFLGTVILVFAAVFGDRYYYFCIHRSDFQCSFFCRDLVVAGFGVLVEFICELVVRLSYVRYGSGNIICCSFSLYESVSALCHIFLRQRCSVILLAG